MDLSKFILVKGLRFDFVAEKLFPANLHPYNALRRLINKGGELTQSQILTLYELTGVTPNELLGATEAWKGSTPAAVSKDGKVLDLKKGDYRAIYSPALGTYALLIEKPEGAKDLGTFAAPANISVRDFLQMLDDQINELS